MLRNYLKIAVRNLVTNRVFAGINIIGLAVGLASCLLLFVYIAHELSYDDFQQKADRIVRVTMEYSMEGKVGKVPETGTKVAPEFGRQFPEVESGVRMINRDAVVIKGDQQFSEKRVVFADSAFFTMFSFPLLKGNPQTALAGPNLVVLSETKARTYFGTENPIGKSLRINTGGSFRDYSVTGVVADCPANSQIKYDLLTSFATLPAAKTEEWYSANYATYLLLRKPDDIAALQAKIPAFMKTQFPDETPSASDYLTYNLEPIRRVHLHSDVEGNFEPNGDLTYIYIFGAIAVLILLIACVNYINLATSRAVERAQEVGVRKVMGAMRGQLFGQFIGESVIVTAVATLLAVLFACLTLPLFNSVSDRQFAIDVFFKPENGLVLLGASVLVSLLAGSYPALVLSGFQPIRVLKGHLKTTGAGQFRRALIVFQFAITAILIVCTLLVRNQLQFVQQKKLGYNKDHVLLLPVDREVNEKISAIKSEFRQNADVQHVSLASNSPVFVGGGYAMRQPGMPEGQRKMVTGLTIDEDFVKTTGLHLIAGSDLNAVDMDRIARSDNDSLTRSRFILNESAVKELGWTPQQAINQRLDVSGRLGLVKGVVSDFHFASMKQKIGPMALFPQNGGEILLVKLSGNQLSNTLQFLESKWRTLIPNRPFTYAFMDEEFDKMYAAETRTGRIFSVFAFLSIFLACLGLFGLSAYTTVQRTKEIGVRKVLGASVFSIVGLLSKDFLKLVLVAIVVAVPIAWYAMNQWLQGFAYRVAIEWWVFALAGILAIGIALITVSFQSIKAALLNPVKSLRSD
ncbi:ABC transporter permease [Spirosoma sp. RP8]|uniref:ABC transporter permease n=1 Tax=Spirosoma liriopis TaxID=2937440 RepID=A0ABT0HKJ3_9BACT|nr:ABC transporter permease [Spirosoma liriopis]MCK8492690.1 ABC transporter permease [Spirosoma liriopis]